MRTIEKALLVVLAASLAGCPQKAHGPHGTVKPQMAVVGWLDAINGGDFDRAAALAPPGIDPAARKRLVTELAEKFSGTTRVDNKPFALSRPDHGKITARVTVAFPGIGEKAIDLTLRQVRGRWYVVPPKTIVYAKPPAPKATGNEGTPPPVKTAPGATPPGGTPTGAAPAPAGGAQAPGGAAPQKAAAPPGTHG